MDESISWAVVSFCVVVVAERRRWSSAVTINEGGKADGRGAGESIFGANHHQGGLEGFSLLFPA